MEYGVYTSSTFEVALTKFWALLFYCNVDKTIIGSKLYNGVNENKTLAAICERNIIEQTTKYAFKNLDGQITTNDFDGLCTLIGSIYAYDISTLKKIDDINISFKYDMPTVSEAGIKRCLDIWRKGVTYNVDSGFMLFQMVTNKIEYVFSINSQDTNIYCGASINILYDNGLFGSNQYFRLRNFADNSQPYCRFHCNIGGNIETTKEVPEIICRSERCISTGDGLFWPVKRYNDNEIVLDGCGGDEYIFKRNTHKSEYFSY